MTKKWCSVQDPDQQRMLLRQQRTVREEPTLNISSLILWEPATLRGNINRPFNQHFDDTRLYHNNQKEFHCNVQQPLTHFLNELNSVHTMVCFFSNFTAWTHQWSHVHWQFATKKEFFLNLFIWSWFKVADDLLFTGRVTCWRMGWAQTSAQRIQIWWEKKPRKWAAFCRLCGWGPRTDSELDMFGFAHI